MAEAMVQAIPLSLSLRNNERYKVMGKISVDQGVRIKEI
jgi:hypothetical protein